jgi:glycosyltransferase involved in cell wall biosynthesis
VTSETAAARQLSRPAGDASFRLVQVASLSRVKNQRLLLDALAIVRKRIDARLDLIGEDTLGGELQKHTAAIGLEPYVTFHGFLRHECVLEILATSDLYVQSSLHEAAGVSVLEAAAAGVPTVGTLAGLVADWSPSKAVGVGAATAASLDYPNYELGTGPRTTEPRNLRTLAERLLSCGAAQLAERMARTLYSWHLTRKSATWFSRDQVRLERECLKLHTSSHRWSTLEKFDRAMADATTKFAKRAAAVDVLAS